MEALIRRFKALAGAKPLLVAPTFYSNYVRFNMGRAYWDRMSSLAADGLHPIDLLPYFRHGAASDRMRAFMEPHDMHFSVVGHQVLADAFAAELDRLRLLPSR
jgi:hypothetical protein